ncbi:reverse transcriptase domain-containing protein [Tanacetum coccineum]
MSWEDFKILTREEFCPTNEMQKLETDLWNHAMVGAGHAAYTDRFHELARLVPHLVTLKASTCSSIFYFFELSDSSLSPALLELPSVLVTLLFTNYASMSTKVFTLFISLSNIS